MVKIICLSCSLIGFNAMSTSNPLTMQEHTRGQFAELASNYEKDFFDFFPELGIFWGKTDVSQDRFADHSIAATLIWQQHEDHYLASINALNENDLKDSPLYITYRLLKETLESSKESRICKEWLWDVNPTLGGWVMKTTRIAEKQPVGTPNDRQLALKRWSTFGTIIDDEINNLKEGIRQGYTAPKAAVNVVTTQLKIILASKPEHSPYFDFAQRDGDKDFQVQVIQLIKNVINPALQRYVDYLAHDYFATARDKIGVDALPNGAACYQAKLKAETTLDITPSEIYQYGLQHMEELKQEVAAIGLKEFGLHEMPQIFEQAKTHPEYLFQSEQDILNYNYAALDRTKAILPTWFGVIPKIECLIKPYPEYRAKTGASGEYNPPKEDGTQPGVYYINTYEPEKRSRIDQEATLFHELLPGHHFQVALTYENKLHHSLDKYLWNAGYGEGWALYAERLADEMGLYKDNISRLGMLSNEALRTARLVVDPGIHVMNWTREQAIAYLKQHTALSDNIIEGEVDRYIMLPGQATAYMLGKRHIESLRHLATVHLQDKFDIREFHDQILKNGGVSLPMLQEQIQHWLATHSSN